MSAGLAVDGAGVHAGSAADAFEGLAFDWPGEDAGAAVVEQNDVEALGAVAGSDAGPEGVVGIHALAGCGSGQNLEHDFKVTEAGHDLLNAGQGDEGAGQGEAHASVALRLDDGDRPRLGDEEVGSADGCGDIQELAAQIVACGVGEGVRIVG